MICPQRADANARFDYDMAVIGGGPAGATFARLAGSKWKIAVLDRKCNEKKNSDGIHAGKCCGGLLAPDAQRQLAVQGLTLPLKVLVDPQIFAVRTIDLSPSRREIPERYYQRPYINIDRAKFDRWLLSLLKTPVLFDDALVQSVRRKESGGFEVTYRRDGKSYTLTSRWLVGADGGGSLVRRTFFPKRIIRQYAAVQEWYEGERLSPFYGALFDTAVTDCYGWMISKNNRLVLGAAFPLEGATKRFSALKEKLESRGYHFGERLRREGCIVCRPQRLSALCTGTEDIFLVGEAAGFISPSSLEGISYALESGALLAGALEGGEEGACSRYRKATRGIRLHLMGKLAKNPFLYNSLLRRLILQSGVTCLTVRPENGSD